MFYVMASRNFGNVKAAALKRESDQKSAAEEGGKGRPVVSQHWVIMQTPRGDRPRKRIRHQREPKFNINNGVILIVHCALNRSGAVANCVGIC